MGCLCELRLRRIVFEWVSAWSCWLLLMFSRLFEISWGGFELVWVCPLGFIELQIWRCSFLGSCLLRSDIPGATSMNMLEFFLRIVWAIDLFGWFARRRMEHMLDFCAAQLLFHCWRSAQCWLGWFALLRTTNIPLVQGGSGENFVVADCCDCCCMLMVQLVLAVNRFY